MTAAASADWPQRTIPTINGGSPQLLERTFATLALFTPERLEWTMTEIARACGLAVPTVHRIVSALQRNGFLVRDDATKRYTLGPAAVRLGRTAAMRLDVRAACRPVLTRVADRTRETALITTVADDRRNAVCLDRVESSEPLRLSVQRGREMPLHAGALQKVLLAYTPAAEVDRYLAEPMQRVCSATITDPAIMREQLAAIRQAGFAFSFEETNAGVWGLAVALLDEVGHPKLAFGVAGPRERKPRMLGAWLSVLAKSSHELASTLGLQSTLRAMPKASAPARPMATGSTLPTQLSRQNRVSTRSN